MHLLPRLVEPAAFEGGVAVVIDQLRASSTITAALAAGAMWVRPVVSVEEARAQAAAASRGMPSPPGVARVLLGGERGGVRIEGFDLANSPEEYTRERVGGRGIVFTTTNGTAALAHAARARRVVVGCLANLSAVSRAVQGESGTLHLVCAGTHGLIGLDDVLTAGAFVEDLLHHGRAVVEDDSALLALETCRRTRMAGPIGVLGALRTSLGGRNLLALGLDADLQWCARSSVLDVVPEFDVRTGLITARTAAPADGPGRESPAASPDARASTPG